MPKPFLVTFTVTLFALLNAIGMVPVFIAFTASERKRVQMLVALFVSITALALMLLVQLLGAPTLSFLGISIDSFRIAGGILLLLIGISMINGNVSGASRDVAEDAQRSDLAQAESVYRRIVVPMAMPLLVGPGVIAYIILHAGEARASGQLLQRVDIAIGISIVAATCFVILWAGRAIQQVLGSIGLTIMTRIMGLLVAAIGVQFIVTGLTAVLQDALRPVLHATP